MARVIIEHGFKYAFRGVEVVEYTASEEEQDLPDEVSDLAVQQGWARLPEPAPAEPAVAQDEPEPAKARP